MSTHVSRMSYFEKVHVAGIIFFTTFHIFTIILGPMKIL